MDADFLLRELAPLSFPRRQRRIAETARRDSGSPAWSPLLADLLSRGPYERRLAVLLASVARDLDPVRAAMVAALRDGHAQEAARAMHVAVDLGVGADDLVAVFPLLSAAGRRDLVRAVRRHADPVLADALLPAVRAAFGEPAAAGLLPSCSAEVVARELDGLAWAVTGWGALGHRHPRVVLDHVETLLAEVPRALRAAEFARVGSGVAAAAPHEPVRVLTLLERCGPEVTVPAQVRRRYAALARHDPARTAALLLRPGRTGFVPGRALVEALLPLPDDVLGRLGARGHRWELARFLRVIAPARRVAVFRAAVDAEDPDVPLELLDALPRDERHAVARRLLARPDSAHDPDHRLALVARLPFDEAEPTLAEVTREPTAERRATGYPNLLAAAAGSREPEVVERVVTGLTRLPNEQDPVRMAAVQALARVPARLFTTTAARAVVRIVVDVAAAPDGSWRTRAAGQRIAVGLLREGLVGHRGDLVDAGVAALEALGRDNDATHLRGLSAVLPRAADAQVFAVLASRCAAEARVGDFSTALTLADGLGTDRAARLPGLQDLLGEATRAKQDWMVRRAVTLWLAPAATRDERVELVLRRDRSTVTLDVVARTIAARRTDLLDDVLKRPSRGRFLTRHLYYLPPVGEWSHRWTPRQVERFRTAALALATATEVTVAQRIAGVRELRGLPGATPGLRGLAADPEVVVAEAALSAMGATDEPAAVVPDLVAVLDTDRARVAVPALRRCLEQLAPAAVEEPVRALLGASKVTVRKDAVRLAVDLATPDDVGLLERVWRSPDEHRDVRRAVPPVLRDRLADPRAWTVLAEAVADPATASSVLEVAPVGVPAGYRARWTRLVLAVVDATDDTVALASIDALGRWARYAPAETAAAMVRLVADLGGAGRWRPAVTILVQTATILADVTPLVDAARSLAAAAGGASDPDAAADRDRPVRQRLARLSEQVAAGLDDPALRESLGPLVDVLAGDVATRDLAAVVAVASVVWEATPVEGLRRVLAVADSGPLAGRAAGALRTGLRGVVVGLPVGGLDDPLALLATDPSPAAPHLRLAVVTAAGDAVGWPERWRDPLRELRRHADPDVVRAAVQVVTAPE